MEARVRSSDGDEDTGERRLARGPGRLALSETGTGAAPEEQAPLGSEPSYDEVLDLAVEYSFPCSDPIAVHSCCTGIAGRKTGAC
jgi:hypothetical protein